jgi:hypothetical protein
MIVEPGFLDHWKTRRLVALRSGDESAPNIVLRLWEFCQTRKRWRFSDMSEHDLDVICRANNVKTHLIDAGFLEEKKGTLVVHDWQNTNRILVSAWANGLFGGRPKITDRIPTGNRPVTDRKPVDHINHINQSNQSVPTPTTSTKTSTKARASSKEEVIDYCLKKGIKVEDGEWFFFHCVGNGWTNDGRAIRDWKATLRQWSCAEILPSQKQERKQQRSFPFSRNNEKDSSDLDKQIARMKRERETDPRTGKPWKYGTQKETLRKEAEDEQREKIAAEQDRSKVEGVAG